jgi:hypothetical protein
MSNVVDNVVLFTRIRRIRRIAAFAAMPRAV